MAATRFERMNHHSRASPIALNAFDLSSQRARGALSPAAPWTKISNKNWFKRRDISTLNFFFIFIFSCEDRSGTFATSFTVKNGGGFKVQCAASNHGADRWWVGGACRYALIFIKRPVDKWPRMTEIYQTFRKLLAILIAIEPFNSRRAGCA